MCGEAFGAVARVARFLFAGTQAGFRDLADDQSPAAEARVG
jgi:hypothetical protein